MITYLLLLRGINVGGKNTVPMGELKLLLEREGFELVITYIQSGNVIIRSDLEAGALGQRVESIVSKGFQLDSPLIRVLVLTRSQLKAVINNRPAGFGDQPDLFHSDVIFLMGISADQAMQVFSPREGIDTIWPGNGVIYSQRLSSERTKSRLGTIVGTLPYKSMTIRNWNTTTKLLALVEELDART